MILILFTYICAVNKKFPPTPGYHEDFSLIQGPSAGYSIMGGRYDNSLIIHL